MEKKGKSVYTLVAMVSIIVVNYNGSGLISACLTALEKQTLTTFELIIVDNGSHDDSCAEIEGFIGQSPLGQRTKIVRLQRNLGFAGGNIEGLTHASARFIVLLNNDTEPEAHWLEALVSAAEGDPDAGICASKLVSYDTRMIDSAGDGYTRSLKGFKRGEGQNPGRYDEGGYVFGACAGAALYRRAMLAEIGFLDEDFFLIHEDTDLNFRAKLAGWKARFVPGAVVNHKVTSSIGYMSKMQVYYTLRNSELVRIKNIPLAVFLACFPEFVLGFITEFLFFGIKHRHPALFLKAKRDAIRLIPKMLKKRREIMRDRKMGSLALLKEMTPIWDWGFLKVKVRKFIYG